VNRGTLSVNNLPRVVARIVPRSESNPRPLDHESSALTTTPTEPPRDAIEKDGER